MRMIWIVFGVAWGVLWGDGLRFSNDNYEGIKAVIDGGGTLPDWSPMVLAFSAGSMLLIPLCLLIGFWRRGFLVFVAGVIGGVALSGTIRPFTDMLL